MSALLRALRLLRTNPRLFLRRLAILLRHPLLYLRNSVGSAPRRALTQAAYEAWLAAVGAEDDFPSEPAEGPLLSVLMPVYNVEASLLNEAIASVVGQTYRHWELCIADDASTNPEIRPALQTWTERESRIRVDYRQTSGHISAASNTALGLARGEFVVLLDHDDRLTPDALARIAETAMSGESVDFIYSDEDKLDAGGRRVQPFFKPAWSPTLLTSCNYITHVAALRRSLVTEVGGFREDMVGSQDHDLFLRVGERARAVAHIPRPLYSWRMAPQSTARASTAKPYAIDAGRRALEDAALRRHIAGSVRPTQLNGIFIVRRVLPAPKRIAVVTGAEGNQWKVATHESGIEIASVGRLEDGELEHRLRGVPWDYLLFLDAGSRPRSKDAVRALLEPLEDRTIGISGGRTLQGSNRVLQAGIVIGDGGQPHYAYAGLYTVPYPDFYLNLNDLPREVSAVWWGCSAVRRDVWEQVGCLDMSLPAGLAMVDLCLRAHARGYTTVFMPAATFSRHSVLPSIPAVGSGKWRWTEYVDPFWNPNLNPGSGDGLPFRAARSPAPRIRVARRAPEE